MSKRKYVYYTTEELAYICSMYDTMNKHDIAYAIDRNYRCVLTLANKLKKNGDFEFYKKLAKKF